MSKYIKQGGPWLAAVRSFMQRKFVNGSRVTWGSNDVLGEATVRDFEEAAECAVNAMFPEIDKMKEQMEYMRKQLLMAEIQLHGCDMPKSKTEE